MKKNVFKLVLISCVLVLGAFKSIPATIIVVNKNTICTTNYEEGYKDGFCEGWRDEKGKNSLCPYPPLAPYPAYPKSTDSYKDGYNDGFKKGISDARK